MHENIIYQIKKEIHNYSNEYFKQTNRNLIGFYSNFLNNKKESTLINSFDKNRLIKITNGLHPLKGLDIILHTSEGSINTIDSIINYLHNVFEGDIRIIIPQITRGESTILACSSREILMGDYSTLMTADPKINDKYARNIIEEFKIAKKEIIENPHTERFWKILLKKYPENRLYECKEAIKNSKILLRKSLELSMLKNKNTEVIDHVVNELISCDSQKEYSLSLNSTKCEEIGLNVKNLKEDEKLQNIVLSLHFACINYLNQDPTPKLFFNQNGEFILSNNN